MQPYLLQNFSRQFTLSLNPSFPFNPSLPYPSNTSTPRKHIVTYLSSPISQWSLPSTLIQNIIKTSIIPFKCLLQIQNAINISDPGFINQIKPNTTIKLILTDGLYFQDIFRYVCVAIIMQKQQIRERVLNDLLGKKVVLSRFNSKVKHGVVLIDRFEVLSKYEGSGDKEMQVEEEGDQREEEKKEQIGELDKENYGFIIENWENDESP